jgi:hypothetical protein
MWHLDEIIRRNSDEALKEAKRVNEERKKTQEDKKK